MTLLVVAYAWYLLNNLTEDEARLYYNATIHNRLLLHILFSILKKNCTAASNGILKKNKAVVILETLSQANSVIILFALLTTYYFSTAPLPVVVTSIGSSAIFFTSEEEEDPLFSTAARNTTSLPAFHSIVTGVIKMLLCSFTISLSQSVFFIYPAIMDVIILSRLIDFYLN